MKSRIRKKKQIWGQSTAQGCLELIKWPKDQSICDFKGLIQIHLQVDRDRSAKRDKPEQEGEREPQHFERAKHTGKYYGFQLTAPTFHEHETLYRRQVGQGSALWLQVFARSGKRLFQLPPALQLWRHYHLPHGRVRRKRWPWRDSPRSSWRYPDPSGAASALGCLPWPGSADRNARKMDGYCPEDGSVDKAGTPKDPLPRTVGKFTA